MKPSDPRQSATVGAGSSRGTGMTIPTRQQFEEYIALASDFNAASLADRPREGITPDSAVSLLEAANTLLATKAAAMAASPVHKWLFLQGEKSRKVAHALLRQPFAFDAFDHDAAEQVAAMLERANAERAEEHIYELPAYNTPEAKAAELDRLNSEPVRLKRFQGYVNAYLTQPRGPLQHSLGNAFWGYFHGERYRQLGDENGEGLRAARQLLGHAMGLLEGEEAASRLGVNVHVRQLQRLVRDLEARILLFDYRPIQRLDATAPQRALAFDLWQAFVLHFRQNKTAAIEYLMRYEGVDGLERRAIQNLIKGWLDNARQMRAKVRADTR